MKMIWFGGNINMTVRNIIKNLLEYNLDAEISIVDINGQSHNIVSSDFGYGAGDGEGVSKTNTSSVSINIHNNDEIRNIPSKIEDCETFEELNRFIDAELVFNEDFEHYRDMYSEFGNHDKKSLDEFIQICKNYITITK